MNYKETVEYLFNSTPVFEHVGASAYKEGLFNTLELDKHFGHPHLNYKTIHVAGTNGKGSCSHSIAAILQSEGYNVGLYTSPHLVDFRERIRVNGECISEKYIIDFVENERSFFEPLHPSFFEVTTALAFIYFAEQNVDIAVIEVGLGGRLDCTNIITPAISIITNISFDHTQFLGNTLAKIAGEKAGIIKRGVPVIVGEYVPETRPVFEAKANEIGAPIFFAEEEQEVVSSALNENGKINYNTKHYGIIQGELRGIYQEKNTNTILCALNHCSDIIIHNNSLKTGLANVCELTGLTGRWQKLQDKPTVICDTGHNVGGWQYLSRQLKAQKCKRLRIVFGMVDDKDIDTVMRMLPTSAKYYFTKATSKRAIPEKDVRIIADRYSLEGKAYSNVTEAYQAVLNEADKDDLIFVGGSSYIVADLLTTLAK